MKVFLFGPGMLPELALGFIPVPQALAEITPMSNFLLTLLSKEFEKKRFVITRSVRKQDPLYVDQNEAERLLELFREAIDGDKETKRHFDLIALPAARHQIAIMSTTEAAWLIEMKSATECEIYTTQ